IEPGASKLSHGLFHFGDPVGAFEDFAGFGAVGGSDNAVVLHEIDEVGRAAVSDAQAALQQRSRGLAELHHQAHGVVIEGIVLQVSVGDFGAGLTRFALFFRRLGELLFVFRGGLRLPEFDDGRDFFLGDEWAEQEGRYSMSPRPSRASAPLESRMVRESTFVATRNEMRAGKLALISPVMTSTEGRWVASTR